MLAATATPPAKLPPSALPADLSAVGLVAWAKRRPAWTRTDTTRWLNERSASVLAWLRRSGADSPAHSSSIGQWLKDHQHPLYPRAHARLLACLEPAQREKISVPEVLR